MHKERSKMSRVFLTPGYFPTDDIGRPISGAQIFVGEPDTDPEVVINQKQVTALQEDGVQVNIAQPIRTGAGGVPLLNGSTVTLSVDGDYSLKVLDSLGSQIYFVPRDASFVAPTVQSLFNVDNILDLIGTTPNADGDVSQVSGYFTSFPQTDFDGGGVFVWQAGVNKDTANGGTIIDPDNTGGFDGTITTRDAFLAAQGGGVGSGCWIRDYDGNVLSPWFGSLGNDSDDDSAAITKGVVVANASAVRFVVTEGTFLIDSYDVPTASQIVSKSGAEYTTLKLRTDVGTTLLNGDGVSDILISGFTLDTQKSTFATLRTTVFFNGTLTGDNIKVENCIIPGSTSAGIVIDNTSNVVIEGNDIQDCVAGDCTRCSVGSDIVISNNVFSNLPTLATNRRVIQIGSSTGFIVTKNIISGVQQTFVYDFGGSDQGTLSGDVVSNCHALIDFEGDANDISIVGNAFAGTGLNDASALGIVIFENPSGLAAKNITISGNTLANFFHGIRIEGGQDTTITGNTISDMQGHGISVLEGQLSSIGATNISVSGNMVRNCSKSSPSSFDGISMKADRGLISGNFVRGLDHRFSINTDAANTTVNVFGNHTTESVNRGESVVFGELSNQRIHEGSADPEGFVTAPPGDLYLRSSGGAGTTLYVKETGTSNTGWVGK